MGLCSNCAHLRQKRTSSHENLLAFCLSRDCSFARRATRHSRALHADAAARSSCSHGRALHTDAAARPSSASRVMVLNFSLLLVMRIDENRASVEK